MSCFFRCVHVFLFIRITNRLEIIYTMCFASALLCLQTASVWRRWLSLRFNSQTATRTLQSSFTSKASFLIFLHCPPTGFISIYMMVALKPLLITAVRLCLCFSGRTQTTVLDISVNNPFSLYRFINITIDFQLKAINLQTIINNEIPDCYTFYITVSNCVCVYTLLNVMHH